MSEFDLDAAIRRVPDFPKPGIMFYDITSVIAQPQAFSHCIDKLLEFAMHSGADTLAAVEARGFLFAAPMADRMKLPLILLRKKGKLPGKVYSRKYELEYGQDEVCVHQADVKQGANILLVDDLIATGGTLKASCDMLEEAGARIAGIAAVIGLPFLKYSELLQGRELYTLVNYHAE